MENFKYIQQEVNLLKQLSKKYNKKIISCTIEEVKSLELMLPYPHYFPTAYKELLLDCGKESAEIFHSIESGYEAVKKRLSTQNQKIIRMVQLQDIPKKKELPADLFVIEDVDHNGCFTYFLLSEGNNPAVYFWEEGEGGLEFSEKIADSFTSYFRKKISIKALHLAKSYVRKKIEEGEVPRGIQIWIPEESEYSQGVSEDKLSYRLGFSILSYLNQAKSICGLDTCSYLEELSGWKAKKVGDEIRFFPPSNIAK